MKKVLSIIFASLTLASCNDWLDVSSSTQIKGDDIFSTEAGFQDALTGVYLNLASKELYGKNLTWYFAEIISQPYQLRTTASDLTYIYSDTNYQNTYSQVFVEKIWGKAYTTIANINNEIKQLDAESGILDARSKSLMYGELYGLRAYIHLDLMRLYGYGDFANREDCESRLAIPYVSAYSKELTEQKPYAETMQLLIGDLEKAIEYLKVDPIYKNDVGSSTSGFNTNGYWTNRKTHLNYYAAQAVLARAYMWMNDAESRAKAVTIAEELIAAEGTAYSWNKYNSADTYIDRDFSTEQLFSLNVYSLRTSISSYLTDLTYAPSADTNIYDWGDMAYTLFNAYSYDYDSESYVPGYLGYDDYRFQLHLKQTMLNSNNYYMCYKLYQTTDSANPYNDLVPMIKIDEMYYILAENYLAESEDDKVLETVNTVRRKHGATQDITQEIIDNDLWSSVRTELLKEVMRSYMGEGQSFYFLKRWNVATYNDEGIYYNCDRTFDDAAYVLPYPQDETSIGNRVQ